MSKKSEITVYEYDETMAECPFDGKYRKLDISIFKYITNRVRRTIEYKNFINYMKKTMNINHCSFYKDYTMDKGFIIELHHAPLCLFDYVETICKKYFSLDKDDPHFETWRVEEDVNKLHYEFMVGLVPLNPTAHKLVHSGSLKVHPRMVEGNWRKFITEYDDFISDEIRGKIEEFEALGRTDPDKVPEIVKYKPVLISNSTYKSLGNLDIEKLIVSKLKDRFIKKHDIQRSIK